MSPGETVVFAGHSFRYDGADEFDKREAFGTAALVAIDALGRESGLWTTALPAITAC